MTRNIFGTIAIGFAMVLFLVGCGSTSASNANTNSLAGTSTPISSAPTPTPTQAQNQTYKVGDIVNIGDTWQITISSIATVPGVTSDVTSGNYYPNMGPGKHLIAIALTAKNISNKEQIFSSAGSFKLTTQDGIAIDQGYVAPPEQPQYPAISDGKVEPGQQTKGNIFYVLPKQRASYTLAFDANLFQSGLTMWSIKV